MEEIKNEELTKIEKLDAGIEALKSIDEELFAAEIKTIQATRAAVEKKEEIKSWWNEHRQDIVNGVVLVALAYLIFRVTL